jgi:PQQ-dependent catabolism-associated CXXCW motif protein
MRRRTILAGAGLLVPGVALRQSPRTRCSARWLSHQPLSRAGACSARGRGADLARSGGADGERALLIDVLPAEGGHRDADGTWHLARPRPSIPGAHWFPEAGRGVLEPAIAHWFERGVARLTKGDRQRMIVTFCLADCWMSWNAARRLHALGYTNVHWLAEGTDGWRELGLPLADAVPEPG